ncbi:hypothetical protein HK100_006083, partial [Physocladia obscura]
MIMQNTGTIHAFDKDPLRLQTLIKLTGRAKCKNIKPLRTSFLDINPLDKTYAEATHILLDPSCSGSGITRRLDHLLVEGADDGVDDDDDGNGDENGGVVRDENRIQALSDFQFEVLMHAFKFPKVTK